MLPSQSDGGLGICFQMTETRTERAQTGGKIPSVTNLGKIVDPHAAEGQRCTQGTEKYHVIYTKPIQSRHTHGNLS